MFFCIKISEMGEGLVEIKWSGFVKSLASFHNLWELLLILLGMKNLEKVQFHLPFPLQLDTKE